MRLILLSLVTLLALPACGGGGGGSGSSAAGGGGVGAGAKILLQDAWFLDHAFIGDVQLLKSEGGIQTVYRDLGHLHLLPRQACWISESITASMPSGVYTFRVDIHRANGSRIDDFMTAVFIWPPAVGDIGAKIGFVDAVSADDVLATNPVIVGCRGSSRCTALRFPGFRAIQQYHSLPFS